jgi:predicted nucleic acid-binding protein
MTKLLADTSALLALALDDDRHHAAATAFVRAQPSVRFVLTELILAEFATRARVRLSAGRVAGLARSLLESRRFDVVFVDGDLLGAALGRLERFADKRLSLADCASFELMGRLGISVAFTFDRNFRDCGYEMVP